MDILAHGLWAGIGSAATARRWRWPRRGIAASMALAVLPDTVHMLPIVAWAPFGPDGIAAVWAYATALPGQEPAMPALVHLLAHHLHCVFHSAIVAGLCSLLVWRLWPAAWLPLLGWWSHVVIDVFSHSSDFYPSPVLYPITQRGFDGLAWNTPGFQLLNYLALAAAALWLWRSRRGPR